MAIQPPNKYGSWMDLALHEARSAAEAGDVPVGAIIVDRNGQHLSSGRNEREQSNDPTAHAEILAIRKAAQTKKSWRLTGTTLIVTLEPCIMCASAIVAARIDRVIFGAWDEKAGGAGSLYDLLRDRRQNHRVEVISGVEEDSCSQLLTRFFRNGPPSEM